MEDNERGVKGGNSSGVGGGVGTFIAPATNLMVGGVIRVAGSYSFGNGASSVLSAQ